MDEITRENREVIERVVHSLELEERQFMLNELVEDISRATFKKIQFQKENITKQLKEADSSITDVTITSRNDDLKYWDETDKIRKVEKVEMGVAGPVIGPAILSDLDIILAGSEDQKSKDTKAGAQGLYSSDYDQHQAELWAIWDKASMDQQKLVEDPEEEDMRFSEVSDAIENPDTPVKPKPFWRFR